MGLMSIKDMKEIKDTIHKMSAKGFLYFIKNSLLYILILICGYFLLNFDKTLVLIQSHQELSLAVILVIIVMLYELSVDKSLHNQKKLLDKYIESQKQNEVNQRKKHDNLVNYRIEISSKISGLLKDLLIDLDATRACVLEMHNGTNNLAGMPFLYADMVYEEVVPGKEYCMDEYKNFNLSKYRFITNHYKDGMWIGRRESIEIEDKRLSANMLFYCTEYLGTAVLFGKNKPLGFLVISFDRLTDLPNKEKIMISLAEASQKISTFLTD